MGKLSWSQKQIVPRKVFFRIFFFCLIILSQLGSLCFRWHSFPSHNNTYPVCRISCPGQVHNHTYRSMWNSLVYWYISASKSIVGIHLNLKRKYINDNLVFPFRAPLMFSPLDLCVSISSDGNVRRNVFYSLRDELHNWWCNYLLSRGYLVFYAQDEYLSIHGRCTSHCFQVVPWKTETTKG